MVPDWKFGKKGGRGFQISELDFPDFWKETVMLDCKFLNRERLVLITFFSTSKYLEIWNS